MASFRDLRLLRPDPDAPDELPPRPARVPDRWGDGEGLILRAIDAAEERGVQSTAILEILQDLRALRDRYPRELDVRVAFHDGDAAAIAEFLGDVARAVGTQRWYLSDRAEALADFTRFAAVRGLWMVLEEEAEPLERDYRLALYDPQIQQAPERSPSVAAAGQLLRDAVLTAELLGIDGAEVAALLEEAERDANHPPIYQEDMAAEIADFLDELRSELGRRAPARWSFRRHARGGLVFESGGRRLERGRDRFAELATLCRSAAGRALWLRGAPH